MHIYTYVHVRTRTYIHIYTLTHRHTTCAYARTQARLERWRFSDRVRSPTGHQKTQLFSLSAAIQKVQKGVTFCGQQPNCLVLEEGQISVEQPQLTVTHLTTTTARHPDYWCRTNPPNPWPLQPQATAHPRRSSETIIRDVKLAQLVKARDC